MKTTTQVLGIFWTALIMSISAGATASDSVIEAAERDNTTGAAALLDPNEAMELVMSSPLKYIGSFIPANSESGIPSCLFRNAKVTVKYTYCRKSEAPAVSITVYSNIVERGHIRFYAEGDGRPVSELNRDEYVSYMWKFLARPDSEGYRPDLTAAEYGNYFNKKEISDYRLGCHVWEQVGQKDLTAGCVAPFEFQVQSWLPGALEFWYEPPQSWYDVQKLFRKLVAAVP